MIALLVLLAVVDVGIAGAAVFGGLHAGIALLAHLILALKSLAVWWRSGRQRRFAPVLGMALGPVGVVFAMFAPPIGALARQWRFLRLRPLVGSKYPVAHGRGGAMVARLLDGRVRHPEPDSLGSLISVMRYGSLDDRREALETTVRNFDSRLSTVVAMALTDDDQTIRALAAAASNRLSQRLSDDRSALSEALATGDDHRAARLRAVLMDHSRFDVLLSDPLREQIVREASKPSAVGAATDDRCAPSDDEGQLISILNQSWKTQNFEMIDLLCRKAAQTDRLKPDPMWTAATWWAAQPCS